MAQEFRSHIPVMRKLLSITLAFGMAVPVMADIQSPPGAKYNSTRKLGRAVSNLLYGVMEIPEQIVRKTSTDGGKAGWSFGVVDGTSRTLRRIGYGCYELITFHSPTNNGTFKPLYSKCGGIQMSPRDGLSEFPPELAAESYFNHTRLQKW